MVNSLGKETAGMMRSKTNPQEIEFYSYANTFPFCDIHCWAMVGSFVFRSRSLNFN